MLAALPAESVHMVCTSPPYFGLRDYGVVGQIGLEPSPDAYVEALVGVFREVRRVLRNDGTVWLNLGDSYCTRSVRRDDGMRTVVKAYAGDATLPQWKDYAAKGRAKYSSQMAQYGLKDKDLMMIPARVALALQADGWWLRSDIIWSKPNPMPESVTDRPTSAHEHIFLLAKAERYYFDADAVREPHCEAVARAVEKYTGDPRIAEARRLGNIGAAPDRGDSVKTLLRVNNNAFAHPGGRNIRNVWTVASQPYPDAHFATFPPALIEPCIKAGTSEKGCCPSCGTPWVRVRGEPGRGAGNGFVRPERISVGGRGDETVWEPTERPTIGWEQSCACPAARPVPATVLDPFFGAGTSGLVADRLGRNCIGIELNPEYAAMAERRVQADGGMFANVESRAKAREYVP